MKNVKKVIGVLLAVVLCLGLITTGVFADNGMDVTLTGDTLTVSSSATATLSEVTVSIVADTSTGSIANVSVTDPRGTGAGWSVVMTSQHFTTRAVTKELVDTGTANTVDFTGTYDGLDGVLDPVGTFKVEIVGTGDVGVATFKWWDPAGTLTGDPAPITTAATVVLSNGISVTFAADDYAEGDSWSAAVDVFPYTGLTVTPGTITAASGSLTNVNAGDAGALVGSGVASDAKALMTVDVNFGLGDYDQAPGLSLAVHANCLAGNYTATVVITVS